MEDESRPRKHVIIDLGDPNTKPIALYTGEHTYAQHLRQGRLNWQAMSCSIDDSQCSYEEVWNTLGTGDVSTLKFRCAVPTSMIDDFLCPHLGRPVGPKEDNGEDSDNEPDGPLRTRQLQLRRTRELHLGFQEVLALAERLVNQLPPGTLRKFSWDMTTCVSSSLIVALAVSQPELESLSLTTDAFCPVCQPANEYLVDLDRFRNLKSISCSGIQPHNRKALQRAIFNNLHHLETLEIDAQEVFSSQDLYPRRTIWSWDDAWEAVVTQFLDPKACFPALRNLRLERMAFADPCIDALKRQVDFSSLESCSIVQCGEDMDLVDAIANHPQGPPNLKRLEIAAAHLYEAEGAVGKLLNGTNGLVDLFMSVNAKRRPETGIIPIWKAIQNHRTTLKRLVYQRNIAFSDEDSWDGSLRVVHVRQSGISQQSRMDGGLPRSRASNFSAIPPDNLNGIHSERCPEGFDKVVKISHQRLQDPSLLDDDFRAFLDWAFGPTGIFSLQVVAFGDFAYRRTSLYLHNLIIRRVKNSYQYLVFDPRDAVHREWEHLVESDWDFLSACPFETYCPRPTDIY
ncbi:hypothetical protein B0J18DRAFT_473366 [Chaetomium sp. MPI-SDFR-AT-0129]|nr:hypothetical protein B0J18DRAFT_473366 [Chaetomium sp. MPI-SDFR-AT-0129]